MYGRVFVEDTTKEGLKVLVPMDQEIAAYPIGTEVDYMVHGKKDPQSGTVVGFQLMCMQDEKLGYEASIVYCVVDTEGNLSDVDEQDIVFYLTPELDDDTETTG